jgi:hypothetical protein
MTAWAREDRDGSFAISVEVFKIFQETTGCVLIDGISHFGPVDDD